MFNYLEVFLAISVTPSVAFSSIDAIPTLSAPFQTPSKKVFQPRPIIAKKSMPTIINTKIPMAPILFPIAPFNGYEYNLSLYGIEGLT